MGYEVTDLRFESDILYLPSRFTTQMVVPRETP